MGRIKLGIRSMRTLAASVHKTPDGDAVCSVCSSMSAKGHPGLVGSLPPDPCPSLSDCTKLPRTCSYGLAGAARPPTFTPKVWTSCVSHGLVSMATRQRQRGQTKVASNDPSCGPLAVSSFIPSSQLKQRNFIPSLFLCVPLAQVLWLPRARVPSPETCGRSWSPGVWPRKGCRCRPNGPGADRRGAPPEIECQSHVPAAALDQA